MTTFSGVIFNEAGQGAQVRQYYFPNTSTSVTESQNLAVSAVLSGKQSDGTYTAKPGNTDKGILLPGSADITIFNRQYLFPVKFDLGLIVETVTKKLTLWNADYNNAATVSQIQQVNPSGTQLTTPATPFIVPRGWNFDFELKIFKDGPAVQNTDYIFTVGSNAFTSNVSGQRVLAWRWPPNWDRPVKISYTYLTVIGRNRRLVEQRRPLVVTPLRELEAEFLFCFDDQEVFLHDSRSLVNKIIAVPIFSEPATPTADIQNLTVINTNETLTNFYNLNNLTKFLLLRATDNNFRGEIKEVSSVAASSITLNVPVVEDFKQGKTIIYPAFIGLMESKSYEMATARLAGISSFRFKEIRADTA